MVLIGRGNGWRRLTATGILLSGPICISLIALIILLIR
jgi:hypothetical protein